ncbi:GumC family protein [Primorskyibacter sp. S187A]|uniref:GumC family protein n=1 Tax=Primorskyibacter sp. S187A TaxID=3415130 RepID=UPI003C7DF40D
MLQSQTSAHAKDPSKPLDVLRVIRQPLRGIGIKRLLSGGRVGDLGRLPRYVAMFGLSAALLWAPISGYLMSTPPKYSSHASLILPGSGASASVNLNNIGQASSYANSAFANGSISPTQTYKRLIGADRILAAAAETLGASKEALPKPRIKLVDQTSLIHIEVKSGSPGEAQAYGDALLAAFFAEIDALRADEIATRERSGTQAIEEYNRSVEETRARINRLQKSSGLTSVDQYTQQVAANDALKTRITTLAAARDLQAQKVAAFEASLGLSAHTAAATLKLYADATYLTLLSDIALQSGALAQAQSKFGPRHPARQKAQARFEAARQALMDRAWEVTGLKAEELTGLDRAPDGQRAQLLGELVREASILSGLEEQSASLERDHTTEAQRLMRLAPIAAQLEDMQRDFNVAEAVFASAIARSEAKKTDVYASYPLVQVLENPSLPERPSSPNRKLSIAAGIAGTLMLMIGFLLAWIRRPIINKVISRSFAAPAPSSAA